MAKDIRCIDTSGACFARGYSGYCRILRGELFPCHFKKPDANVTDGKTYCLTYKEPGTQAIDERRKAYVDLDAAVTKLADRTGYTDAWLKAVLGGIERVYK